MQYIVAQAHVFHVEQEFAQESSTSALCLTQPTQGKTAVTV